MSEKTDEIVPEEELIEEYGDLEPEVELVSDYESIPCEKLVPSKDAPSEFTPKNELRKFVWNEVSMYDHIRRLLEYLIATRPENTIDYFDQFSRSIRYPKEPVNPEIYLKSSSKLVRMFRSMMERTRTGAGEDEEEVGEEDDDQLHKTVTSFLNHADYFEEMGVALPKSEVFLIDAAVRKLAQKEEIAKARFWGKIFGVERSYIIAECELTFNEKQMRIAMENEKMFEEGEEEEESLVEQPPIFGFSSIFKQDAEEEEEIIYKKLYGYRMPPLPLPKLEKVIKTAKELIGEGTNKMTYYICHEPGEDWVELPDVRPEHIVSARQIRKYLRGYISAEIDCYPPFPGKEREYLRAQIARISAGTHVSPLGYYQFGSPDEMEELAEEGNLADIVVNVDFEPIPYQDLLDPAFWVHHVAHILKIGRTTYWEPKKELGEEVEEEEPDKEKENEKREIGPPILTPLSEDVALEGLKPWTTKQTSKLIPGSGVVAIFSNLWPGAYAFCKERTFENVYLGWGLKHSSGFSPSRPPRPQTEYITGPEIMETTDPTPEEEEQWRLLHEVPILPTFGEEEEQNPIYSEPEDSL